MSDWEDNKYTIDFYLSDLCNDSHVIKNYPRIVNTFERLSKVLTDAIRKMADESNGDSTIESNPEFENLVIRELREALSMETELEDINNELDKIEERFRNIKRIK